MSRKERRFSFFWNDEPACWKKHNVEPRTASFLTNFDGEGQKLHVYPGPSDVDLFAGWLIEPQIPPLVQFDMVISETMRSTKIPTVILFRPEEDEFEDYAGMYKNAAIANRGKAIFVWADKDDPDGNDIAKHMKIEDYGLDPGGPVYPSVRLIWIYRNERHISQIEPHMHTVETVTDFLDKCLNGTHDEFLPSDFRQKYFDQRFIPSLTGRTYKQNMTERHEDQDVVVFHYSPTCPHCEKYQPEYIQLAEMFAARPNIRFMMFDAVNNMVKQADANRYPILRFFPRENRTTDLRGIDIAEYKRDQESVVNWLLENSSALKDYGLTKEILVSEEEVAAAAEARKQWDVLLNETAQAEVDAQEAAKNAAQKEMEEAKKQQKEQAEKEKEYKEMHKKASEEKAKVYRKDSEEGEEFKEIDKEYVPEPSTRIPGKKKKAMPGDKVYDEQGREMHKMSDSEAAAAMASMGK